MFRLGFPPLVNSRQSLTGRPASQPDLDNPSLIFSYHMIREYITLPVKTTSDKELISRICREFKHLKKKEEEED